MSTPIGGQGERMKFLNAIKRWWLWHFKMTEQEKELFSLMAYGWTFKKDGKVIHPRKVYK